MKYILFVVLFVAFEVTHAQSLPAYDEIVLEKSTDYKPANQSALAAANYILSKPIANKDLDYLKSLKFMIKWMSGTPDYMFDIDAEVGKLVKGSDALVGVYMAAMTKYCLEHPDTKDDQEAIKNNSLNTLIEYCENPANKVKMNRALRRLADEKRVSKSV